MTDTRTTLRKWHTRLRETLEPRHRPLLVAGVVVTAIGAVLPWAVSGVGYTTPLSGNLNSVGLGGHRLYVFVLALLALVALTRLGGRRRVAVASGLADLAISLYTLRGLFHEGGGLGAVGIGAWVAVVGSLILLIAADAMSVSPSNDIPDLPAVIDIAIIFVVIGVVLFAVVIGLDIESDKQFLAFSLFAAALIRDSYALGATQAFKRAFDQYRYVGYAVAAAAAF